MDSYPIFKQNVESSAPIVAVEVQQTVVGIPVPIPVPNSGEL
jgi:hypothetical protein